MPAKRRDKHSTQEHRDAWKEKIQAGHLMVLLNEMASGKRRAIPAKIKAIEVALDRVLPRLQATELTQVSDLDTLSREEILDRIQALLAADPSLLPELVGLDARNKAKPADPEDVSLSA